MADDDIEDIEFDDSNDELDEIEFEKAPSVEMPSRNARRELEKRLEMKRLKEMLGSEDFDEDF